MGELSTTTINLHSSLIDQLTAVNEKLKPASPDGIASKLLKLKRAGLNYPPGLDPSSAASIYNFALKDLPNEALSLVCIRILQGEIKGVKDFIPTPPALAALTREQAGFMWRDRERIKLALESMSAGDYVPPSDDAKSRVRAMVQAVKDEAERIKQEEAGPQYSEAELNRMYRNKTDPPPRPPEDGGYFRAMQDQEENENGEIDSE